MERDSDSDVGAGRARAVLSAVGIAAAALAASLLAQVIALIPLRAVGLELGPVAQILLALFLVQGVGFIGVSWTYLAAAQRSLGWPRLVVPTRFERRWALIGYLLALGGAVVGALALRAFGIDPAANELVDLGQAEPRVFLLLVPVAFLLIGPAEELLFRGVIQRRLRQRFGPAAAVALASAIFAVAHLLAVGGDDPIGRLAAVAVLFLPSVALGAVYERTGNLTVPILVHGAYDATLFLALYAAV